jgi:uncharacterized phage-associated protein
MQDLASSISSRFQRTTDGHRGLVDAVENAFGAEIDYTMRVKISGMPSDFTESRYSPATCIGCRTAGITFGRGIGSVTRKKSSVRRRIEVKCWIEAQIMPYPAKAIANEFLELARKEGKTLTQMQLQKLVYFAYGWYLVITGKRLIDERVEAWQWGPVIPSIYKEFKRFGSSPITELAHEVTFKEGKLRFSAVRLQSDDPEADALALQVIKRVWETYGKYSASALSNMTHAPNSPWTKTPEKEIKGTDIPDELIIEYFRELANQHEQHA